MTTTNARQIQVAHPKAAEITYGCELEVLAERGTFRIGAYHHGIEIGGEFPPGWNAQKDGSLRTDLPNYEGVEIVSPILKGKDGLEQIRKVCDLLNQKKIKVNGSTGVHIHVGVTSVAGENYNDAADWIRRLLKITAQHEMAFYGASGTRRRYDGQYCHSLTNGKWSQKKAELDKKLTADELRTQAAGIDRYQLLNIAPAFGRGTVEFRCFSGSSDALKIGAWVQMCLAAATRALDINTDFDAPRARYAGSGAAGAMRRFQYLMGWTRGRKNYFCPECIVEGWIGDLGQLRAVKKELMRLARKFDAGAATA